METGYNICQRALAPWFSWLFGSDEFISGGLSTRGLGCPPTLVDPINPTFFFYPVLVLLVLASSFSKHFVRCFYCQLGHPTQIHSISLELYKCILYDSRYIVMYTPQVHTVITQVHTAGSSLSQASGCQVDTPKAMGAAHAGFTSQ